MRSTTLFLLALLVPTLICLGQPTPTGEGVAALDPGSIITNSTDVPPVNDTDTTTIPPTGTGVETGAETATGGGEAAASNTTTNDTLPSSPDDGRVRCGALVLRDNSTDSTNGTDIARPTLTHPNGWCPMGQMCDGERCVNKTSLECSADNSVGTCPDGSACFLGGCLRRCKILSVLCGEGLVCATGYCVRPDQIPQLAEAVAAAALNPPPTATNPDGSSTPTNPPASGELVDTTNPDGTANPLPTGGLAGDEDGTAFSSASSTTASVSLLGGLLVTALLVQL